MNYWLIPLYDGTEGGARARTYRHTHTRTHVHTPTHPHARTPHTRTHARTHTWIPVIIAHFQTVKDCYCLKAGRGGDHIRKWAYPLKHGHFWLWMNILVKLRSICLSENTPVYSNTTLRCKQFRHNTVIFSDAWFFPSKIIIIVIVIIIMTGEALFSLYLIVQ